MGAKKKTVTVEIKGRNLTCPICGNEHFFVREALLNTTMATLFGLDWTDKKAKCFVCADCKYIFWFQT